MAIPSSALAEGATIGRYRVLKQLGQGGMGAVYVGEHTELRHKAAIKVLLPALSKHDEIVRRFYNEALAATQVKDPGVVQVFDFDHHTDGRAFIVMELLDGEPMDKRLERIGSFEPSECLRLMWFICTSLGAMHAKGIVHRDLKPENIFLVRDAGVAGGERTKILDFGIAKLQRERNTLTGLVMGTPAYMSPEQIRGASNVDHRSDIYSIGCVMFAMLTGHSPFSGTTPGELNAAHLDQEPPAASLQLPTLPHAVDEIIRHCLRKRPADRFQSMAALVQTIEATQLALQRPDVPDVRHVGRFVSSPTSTTVRSGPTPPHAPESRRGPEMASPRGPVRTTVTEASGAIQAPEVRRRGRTGPRRTVAIGLLGLVGITATVVLVAFRAPSSVTPPPVPHADASPLATDAVTSRSDKTEEAKRLIVKMLRAFRNWAKKNPSAPCPSVGDLAGAIGDPQAVLDPWGHPLSITCTEQPADQIIGVRSVGPDGIKSSDDIVSWKLDSDATSIIDGPRWQSVSINTNNNGNYVDNEGRPTTSE